MVCLSCTGSPIDGEIIAPATHGPGLGIHDPSVKTNACIVVPPSPGPLLILPHVFLSP